jgi:hypothetical protein
MSEFYVHNSLNITKSVKFNITLRYFVIKGERGDHMWVLEIGTTHPDRNGDPISAKKIHRISAEDLDEIIEDALSDLCSQIDWSPFVGDVDAPYVDTLYPEDGTTVSIGSNIYMVIKEKLPAAGIDLSNLRVTLNNSMVDFDITSEVSIEGDPYEYNLKWSPPLRVYDTYD